MIGVFKFIKNSNTNALYVSAYVDFFQKYAPDFYAENKEMIDDIFKEAFNEAAGGVQ